MTGQSQSSLDEPITLMIDVTPTDINDGTRDSGNHCPVARAVERAALNAGLMRRYQTVWVRRHTAFIPQVGAARLPDRITSKIRRFDAGGAMKPTSFKLTFA